jgi:8-oxo-dGTP pyrophosphatase MutT (NUDIX family)
MSGTGRPGYGIRHPTLVELLATLRPVVSERVTWPNDVTVDVAAYSVPARLPAELVTSVRCIVRVDGRVVVCHAPDMIHVWPGGRRLPGETYENTARREVYEETGWLIDETDLRLLGFLHFQYLDVQPADHPYPHPDFLQVVYTAPATDRDGRATDWVDLDGWEQRHELIAACDLGGVELSQAQRAFLRLLPDAAT